jgi:hypothetical protein
VTVVVEAAAPEGVTVAGLKAHPTPEGRPEQAKVTVELKPFEGVTEMVAVADDDLVSLPLPGLIERAKSADGGAVMVTATAEEADMAKLAVSAYFAVMEWEPTLSAVVV